MESDSSSETSFPLPKEVPGKPLDQQASQEPLPRQGFRQEAGRPSLQRDSPTSFLLDLPNFPDLSKADLNGQNPNIQVMLISRKPLWVQNTHLELGLSLLLWSIHQGKKPRFSGQLMVLCSSYSHDCIHTVPVLLSLRFRCGEATFSISCSLHQIPHCIHGKDLQPEPLMLN